MTLRVPAHPTSRCRVGVDFHTFDGIYQGSRSHLLGLYREAIVQAPDIDFVFFLSQPQALHDAYGEFSHSNVELVRMPRRPGVWRLAWQLAALQHRHRLSVLHVQYRLPLLPRGPCICTIHDVLFETHAEYFGWWFVRVARWNTRRAAKRALLTCTVSEYSREQILRLYRVASDRVVLTTNAVDRQRFFPGGEGANALQRWDLRSGSYLCMLGRLEPRKNHRLLIEAYARLNSDAPPLVIVGQRDFAYAGVFELIQRLGLAGRIRILEDVDDEALPAILRHARLLVYPSKAEGFGMPVVEAMASGVPVITSNTTALPEVAGTAAWLITPVSVDECAEALRQALAESSADRHARIARGLRQAATFTWHDAAANLLAAIRRESINLRKIE